MSVIAAADEDIQAGKHTRLSDVLYLCTLPDSDVPSDEKESLKNELMEGIKKYSEYFNKAGRRVKAAIGAQRKNDLDTLIWTISF